MRNDINIKYFNWILDTINYDRHYNGKRYLSLLTLMHKTPFVATLRYDENRIGDGYSLRYRFCYINDLLEFSPESLTSDGSCSVLEMMVALAIRCEENMQDPIMGDRTAYWFWEMMSSLGLLNQNDNNYDQGLASQTIDCLIRRDYAPNGRGGLFTIDNCPEDLRNVEIWTQLNWHLCSKYN